MGIKLEIGCGLTPHEGYEHLDIKPYPHVEYVSDARKIALPDNSCSEIFSLNTIEHFWWFEQEALIKEWARIMEPGGKMLIYTVDFAVTIKDWANGGWKKEVDSLQGPGYNWIHNSDVDRNMWLNYKLFGTNCPGNAHITAFTFELMKSLMEKAGLKNIKRLTRNDDYVLAVEAYK